MRRHSRLVDPLDEIVDVEPQEVPPLDVRNASFEYEAANVSHLDAEQRSDLRDVDQARPLGTESVRCR